MANEQPRIVGFKDLLNLAHQRAGDKGTLDIRNEVLNCADDFTSAFFKCTIVINYEDGRVGHFEAHGDASKTSVKPAMHPHITRIAETRAMVRALRLLCNVGEVAEEELEGYVNKPRPTAPRNENGQYAAPAPAPRAAVDPDSPATTVQCEAIQKMAQKGGVDIERYCADTFQCAFAEITNAEAQQFIKWLGTPQRAAV